MWNAALWDVAFRDRWAGTHFGRHRSQVHGSGRVCLGRSRSKPSDMDSGKPVFMLRALRPALLELQETVPQVLTLSGGAGFIAREFRGMPGVSAPEATLKKILWPTRPFGGARDRYLHEENLVLWVQLCDLFTRECVSVGALVYVAANCSWPVGYIDNVGVIWLIRAVMLPADCCVFRYLQCLFGICCGLLRKVFFVVLIVNQ